MKKISTLFLAFLFLFFSSVAEAHFPTVTIDYIDGISTADGPISLSPLSFPYTFDFEGTVSHEGASNLKQIRLFATVNGEYIYGPRPLPGSGNATVADYLIPWTVEGPGEYQIVVTALHREDVDGKNDNRCKAAPAIANQYFKATDQKGKTTGKNVISEVAKETGKNGALWAKEKCEATYETRTIELVVELLDNEITE